MSVTMDGIYVDGQKAKFRPEDILEGDASAYTEEIGESVTAWLDENVTSGETLVVDNTLTISGAAADAKVTGDKIEALEEGLNDSFTLHDGYYISYLTGELKASSSRHYAEFPVAYGMSVIYRFKEGAAYNFGLAFYNEGGSFIEGHIVTNSIQTITAPQYAVLCRATVGSLADVDVKNVLGAVVQNKLDLFGCVSIDKTDFTVYSNKYAYCDKAIRATYTGLTTISFPVTEGLKFIYSFKNSNPNYVGLHFTDISGGYISGVQAVADPVTVTTPSGAVMCYATIRNTAEVRFLNAGNAILEGLGRSTVTGILTTETPLETITDATGMLDIFLNVGCIGDSLASGESWWNDGGETHGQDFYQYSWGQYLARKTGNKYYNWSSGGQSTTTWLASTYATECFDGEHLCEAYIIGLAQNDANNNKTIGTASDIDLSDYTQNADTFYGNYGKIIQKIKEVQPQAKIFVITDPNTNTNTKGYNTPIRDMATIFDNVYVIDLQQYGLKFMSTPALSAQIRGGHFNAYGYKVFAMMIANYIDWIVVTNYTEFEQVELIGTGYSWT